jgi:putative ABC transport system permease protein
VSSLRLFPYHLRLAVKSLRRDPWMSAAVVLVLGLAGSIFASVLPHYLRIYGPRPPLSPALSQVELPHSRTLERVLVGSTAEFGYMAGRIRVSFPDYRILSSSGLPVRQVATFRSLVVVGRQDQARSGAPVLPLQRVRFAGADFFPLFALPFRFGGPWSREAEARGEPLVVLSETLNDSLFGGADSVGRGVLVEGRAYRVSGVIRGHQPFVPEWDRSIVGGLQDTLYLPFPEQQRLQAVPELPLFASPPGRTRAELFASDAVFVCFFLELPTAGSRAAYLRYLDGQYGARHIPYVLRDLAAIRAAFTPPTSAISFFALTSVVSLLGGGLIMARMLLAKCLVRSGELGIFRAVGAPRAALFWRHMVEAALLSLAGALLAQLLGLGHLAVYNRLVADNDIPAVISGLAAAIMVVSTVLTGLLSAVYPAWRSASAHPTIALAGR